MSSKSYPLRIPESLILLAEAKAGEEHTDRTTALRQLMYAGAEDYVLGLLAEGRISVSRAAELLDYSVHRIHRLARERGVETAADAEQHERAARTAEELL